jgi:replicative DNA helicase
MGKTDFVLSMAKNMAIDYGYPVAIFSLEMSNLELVNRLVINASEIEGEKIKTGRLTPHEWQDLYAKTDCLNSAPIFIDDTANISVSELTTKARRLKSEHDIQCIIIDYLQLMNASGMSYGSREQEVSIISRSLKGLAKELDIPVIALSQLNRGVESREEKRPQLSDLRESGAIEQDADMVVFIHRPEYYKIMQDQEGNSNEGVAEIIIAKHRSGAVGDVRLQFTKELIKFSNLTERRYGNYQADTSSYQEFGNKYNEPMPIQPSSVDPF